MSDLRTAERHAINAILDRPNADPDDDAAVVARAALRLAEPEKVLRDVVRRSHIPAASRAHVYAAIEAAPRRAATPEPTLDATEVRMNREQLVAALDMATVLQTGMASIDVRVIRWLLSDVLLPRKGSTDE